MHDHRKLGRELELFDTDPMIGAGLPYWLPAGAAVRHALEEYIREVERRAGYQHVYSPVLGKRELYEISGHWSHYRDGMYPPMDVGGEQVVLRPSLCPHHALIFRSRGRSYRDLPLRMAELGGMYRSELSGVLGGLTRVRAIQLNDAHIFCTPDQVAGEAAAALGLIRQAYRALGIEPVRYRLSLPGRDGKYVGDRDMWDRAAGLLEQVLAGAGVPYEAEEGEAAFYGPKIDVQIADSAEREASLSTVQVDFYLPERFGLSYVGADGGRYRPAIVHRSIIGSAERAVAHLIDVHGGAGPARGAAGRGRADPGGRRARRAGDRAGAPGRGGPARVREPGRQDPGPPAGAVPGGDRRPRGGRGPGGAAAAGRPAAASQTRRRGAGRHRRAGCGAPRRVVGVSEPLLALSAPWWLWPGLRSRPCGTLAPSSG
jgi:threonyl-tRNA synthetase